MRLVETLRRLGSRVSQTIYLTSCYRKAFGTEDGRVVLEDLTVSFAFLERSTLGETSEATAYHEGQRSVVVHVMRRLHLDAEDLDRMRRGERVVDSDPDAL